MSRSPLLSRKPLLDPGWESSRRPLGGPMRLHRCAEAQARAARLLSAAFRALLAGAQRPLAEGRRGASTSGQQGLRRGRSHLSPNARSRRPGGRDPSPVTSRTLSAIGHRSSASAPAAPSTKGGNGNGRSRCGENLVCLQVKQPPARQPHIFPALRVVFLIFIPCPSMIEGRRPQLLQ